MHGATQDGWQISFCSIHIYNDLQVCKEVGLGQDSEPCVSICFLFPSFHRAYVFYSTCVVLMNYCSKSFENVSYLHILVDLVNSIPCFRKPKINIRMCVDEYDATDDRCAKLSRKPKAVWQPRLRLFRKFLSIMTMEGLGYTPWKCFNHENMPGL